jgi:hypothetical protein
MDFSGRFDGSVAVVLLFGDMDYGSSFFEEISWADCGECYSLLVILAGETC